MGLTGPRSRGARPSSLCAAAAAGVVASLAVASGLAAQESAPAWRVVAASVVADLSSGDGGADVTVDYELVSSPGADAGAQAPWFVPFELLGFDDATALDVRVSGPGVADRRVVLWPTTGSHRAATILVTDPDGDGRATLSVAYRVDRAVREGRGLRGRVPILTGPAAPEAGVDAFSGRLRLPPEWVVSEGFPSGLRLDGEGAYAVSLPVVPSLIGFRARSDGVWRPGLPLLVDLLTLTILIGFAGFGWRHLQGVVTRGAGA